MRDPYKRLSKEWGSKRRKAEGRQRKAGLRRLDREEQAEADARMPILFEKLTHVNLGAEHAAKAWEFLFDYCSGAVYRANGRVWSRRTPEVFARRDVTGLLFIYLADGGCLVGTAW